MEKKDNTIDLSTAKKWGKEWREKESTYNKYHRIKAFNIPKEDLIEVLAEGIESVRAYIGVEKITGKGKPTYVEKLMIVGVNKEGKDMISSKDGENLDATSGSIFDFSSPCPSACDKDSPLY